MRKRFLAVMMAAAMAVTMVGCGKADNSSAADAPKNNAASTSKENKKDSKTENLNATVIYGAQSYINNMDENVRTADIDYEGMIHDYGYGDFWIDWIQEHYDSYVALFFCMMIDGEEPDCSEVDAPYLAAAM